MRRFCKRSDWAYTLNTALSHLLLTVFMDLCPVFWACGLTSVPLNFSPTPINDLPSLWLLRNFCRRMQQTRLNVGAIGSSENYIPTI